jgi:SAM-dependent methyltransferase
MMTNIYEDGTYLERNPTWHEEDSPWKANQIRKMIDRNALHPSSICEVGCGVGEVLNQLSNRYSSVTFTGYEISPQAFEKCRPKAKSNLKFMLEDIFEDPEAYFDIAMAIDVFEHVEDYLGFLSRFREKADYKIFHIPLDLSVQTVIRGSAIPKVRRDLGHLHYFTKEVALQALEETGYQLVDHFYTQGTVELASASRGWKTRLVNGPRRLAFRLNEDLAVRYLGGFSLMVLAK